MTQRWQSRLFPSYNKEVRAAEKLGKFITEDFSLDMERVGFYLVQNLPTIVYHRLDVLFLAAQEEYDRMIGENNKRIGRA